MLVDQQEKTETKEEFFNLLNSGIVLVNRGPKIGKRHIQTFFVFLVVFTNYLIRISLSVLIVAMTDEKANPNIEIPTYNWTDKSLVVSSFMWGYMVPQIGAGYLATVYGSKWFLVTTLITSSSLGFFIPLVAGYFGSIGVMVIRIFQGLSQGFLLPSSQAFLGKWVPINERSRLGSFALAGTTVGIIGATLISGYIAASPLGWPTAYYIFSGLALLVGLIFSYCGHSEPDQHPTITEEEKFYIKNNLTNNRCADTKNIPVPWVEILTSLPFWAIVVTQIGFSWGNWTLLLETPLYMSHVMKYDLKSNSLLSSLPYITEALCTVFYSIIADYFIIKNIFSIATTRKIMNGIAMICSAIGLIFLAYCDSNDSQKAVILLVVIGAVTGGTKSGYNVNQIDLSPNFAGVLMGISNGLSTAICALGPAVVHMFVKNEDDPLQWRVIFYIAAIFNIVAFIFSVIFGSGSVQPWNNGSKKIREKKEEESAVKV